MNSIEFPNEFNSQLSLEGIAFRIKVEQVDWSPENLNVVESFHRCIICTEHETPDLMLVRIKSKECKANTVLDCPHVIDFTAMQRLSHSGGQPQTQIHFLRRALVCRRSCAVSKGLQQVFQVPRVSVTPTKQGNSLSSARHGLVLSTFAPHLGYWSGVHSLLLLLSIASTAVGFICACVSRDRTWTRTLVVPYNIRLLALLSSLEKNLFFVFLLVLCQWCSVPQMSGMR